SFQLQVQREELAVANNVLVGTQKIGDLQGTARVSTRVLQVIQQFEGAIAQPPMVRDGNKNKPDWDKVIAGRDGVNVLNDTFGRDS
ncbi:hypothetical protein ABTH30_22275, partial [Acinetobacter baumannii]